MNAQVPSEKKACTKQVADHTGFYWHQCGKPAKFLVSGTNWYRCGRHAIRHRKAGQPMEAL